MPCLKFAPEPFTVGKVGIIKVWAQLLTKMRRGRHLTSG